jgi:hypothetical protein
MGLEKADAPTPYYYGSVPKRPEPGQTLVYNETGNRYIIANVEGEGLQDDGDGYEKQRELAWADINRGEDVPTLWLEFIKPVMGVVVKVPDTKDIVASGFSADYEEIKKQSQINRATRFSGGEKKKMFYIKGIGGYLCSTERLVMNQKKNAPPAMDATALEYATKAEAEEALAQALKTFGNIPNQLKVVEE